MNADDVLEKLAFARLRMQNLETLLASQRIFAESQERQQLLQEFLFHLVGAADLVAHFVNEQRSLGIQLEDVTIHGVKSELSDRESLVPLLDALYVRTRGKALPSDPYSDEGYLFRIYNYRHQVTHRRRQPFDFITGDGPNVVFRLDPREPKLGSSVRAFGDELGYMLDLMSERCMAAMAAC